ncbi:uncharacterized protein [Lolium perenne]|uniref:uncharacterized protein isoform X2 n=1 Tax=Lolium perenne TaxID=4522 RepID=UPI0021F5DF3E|nr:uncharacterized protein LOC127313084 isoform X3 [Lolium perenne]
MSYHGAHKQCRLPSPACHGIDHEPCRLGQGRWCARHALDDLDAAVSWSSSLLPQSVTKNLSLGAEAFCLAQQRNSGVGFIARYDTKEIIFLMHVHVPQDLKPQQKIGNIYFNAVSQGREGQMMPK